MQLVLEVAVLGLAFAALFTLARRLHAHLERRGASRRLAVVLVLAAIALIPAAEGLAALSDRLREQRLARRTELIGPVLDSVARGAIGPFGRADLHGSLFRLLRGDAVKRSQTVRYRPQDLAPKGGERRSAEEDLPFRIHERVLRKDESLHYPVEPAATVERIAIAVQADGSAAAPALEVSVIGPASARRRLTIGSGAVQLHGWGSDENRVEIHVLALSPPVVGVNAIEVRGTLDPVRISGVCVVGNQLSLPLVPEERTRTGLPVLAGAGVGGQVIPLRPGDRPTEFAFDPPIDCDRLWLVYAATDPRAAEYRWFREDILEIRLEYEDGALPGRLLLCHGVDVHSANLDRSRHAEDFESSVAKAWESDGVRWHSDERGWILGAPHRLRRISLKNRSGDAGYSIDLLGITLGSAVADPASVDLGGVVQVAGDAVRTTTPLRDLLAGVHLAFADQQGVIRAVDGEDGDRLVGATIAEGELRDVMSGRTRPPQCSSIAGIDADVAILPIRDGEAVVGALITFVPEPDRETRRERFAFLPLGAFLLSLPYLLVTFAESLARGDRIRRKIAIALGVASVVPVGALLLAVPSAFTKARTEATIKRLNAELDTIRERLVRQREAAASDAANFLQLLQEHPRAGQLFLDPSRPEFEAGLRREIRQARERQFGHTATFVWLELRAPGAQETSWKTIDDHDGDFSPEGLDLQASDFYRVRDRIAVVGVDRRVEGDRRIRCAIGREVLPSPERGRDARLFGLEGAELDTHKSPWDTSRSDLTSAIALAIRTNRPVPIQGMSFSVVDAFRDREGTPLFAIAVIETVPKGDVVLLGFHTSLAALLCGVGILGAVSALGLARILTERLTAPIERLASAADEARQGRATALVQGGTADEVGVLSERFHAMSTEVRRRMEYLSELQRGMLTFAARLDRHEVALEASRFVVASVGAKSAFLVLADESSRGWRIYTSSRESRAIRLSPLLRRFIAADRWTLLSDHGPNVFQFVGNADRRLTDGAEALLGGPIRLGEREEGLIVAQFERRPDSAQRATMYTAASSVAIALENARMHGLAIQDRATGALVAHYFKQRLEEAVDRARALRTTLWLVRVRMDADDSTMSAVEAVFAALARRVQRASAGASGLLIGRTGPLELMVAVPNVENRRQSRFEGALRWVAERKAGPSGAGVQVKSALFPQDAPSVDLLLALLRTQTTPIVDASNREDLAAFAGGEAPLAPSMIQVVRRAARAVSLDLPVLLLGEAGVGKEWLARRMHIASSGEAGQFVPIRLSNLPESLVDSELFGVERGAFSGADTARSGLFEQANGGTVYLDEVAETPTETQAKLLRVLESRRIRRLGGAREIPLKLRIIASTSQDLVEAVREGRFRSDLYFRLSGILLAVPSLRERQQDLPRLAKQFLEEESGASDSIQLSPRAIDRLVAHSWPGNLAELRGVIRRSLLASEGASEISEEHIDIDEVSRGSLRGMSASVPREDVDVTEGRSVRQQRLLSIRRKGERVTMKEYVLLTGASPRTGLRDLLDLARSGRVRKEGRKRGTIYRIV